MKNARLMAILSILVFATFPASVLARTIKIIDPPYLAVCNGSADTTSAIQGAINDARSGDYIQLPSGTCKVSHTLSLTGKVGIVVFGAGISSTVISSSGSVCRGVHIVGGQDLTFEDLQVACPTSTGGDDGFWVQSATNVNFYRVKVYKTVYGFHALGCTYFGVYDSQMIQTRSAGVQIDGTTTTGRSYSVTISRNYAYQTGDDGYASVGYNGVQNQYVGFYNNTSDQPGLITGGSGITVGGSQYVEVHGNTVTGAAHGAGIRVESERAWGEGASNQVDVYNNNLSELHPTDPANQPAILVYSNTGASISDLHVHQNQVHNPHNYHVFYLYAINGGAIAPYQIQNNTVFDNSGSVDPARMIDLGPGLGGAAISGNYLNGVLIW